MAHPSIAVVGGGIGGMTAAAALAQAGFAVTLLEAAPAFGDVGAGVTLSPNAMKGLDHLGLCEAVAAAGMEPTRQRIQHWQDGSTLVAVDRSSQRAAYGAPYVTIHRADLHALLTQAAREAGATLRTNAPAASVRAGVVRLVDGSEVHADIVVGADGLKSVVRRSVADDVAQFTGHVAWRALVEVDDALRELTEWPGNHIGPGRMITRYPVRGGTLLNLAFFAREAGWQEEGWSLPADAEDLRATYAGWCDEVQSLIEAAGRRPIFKWAIHARQKLVDWSAPGRIVLLGDAAHAMTPFLGQGAACAIEDAVVLARALATATDPDDGLRRYVEARKSRAEFIQAESNANAERMQAEDSRLFGLGGLRNEESLGLFDYDCRTTPV